MKKPMPPSFLQPFLVTVCILGASSQIVPDPGCRPLADLIFLLDGSDSISEAEFNEQREFIRRFVQKSDVGPDTVRVGVAVVSSGVGDVLPLSANMSKQHLLHAIHSVSQPQEGSRTDLGLIEMEQLFGTQGRRGVIKIGVVLTDGRAKYERATEGEAQVVKDAGVFLIAIGVGRLIKFAELEKIASTKNNAYNLEPLELSTKLLHETVTFLGQESCAGRMLIEQMRVDPLTPSNANVLDNTISTALINTLKKALQATTLNSKLGENPFLTQNKASPLNTNVLETLTAANSGDYHGTNLAETAPPTIKGALRDTTVIEQPLLQPNNDRSKTEMLQGTAQILQPEPMLIAPEPAPLPQPPLQDVHSDLQPNHQNKVFEQNQSTNVNIIQPLGEQQNVLSSTLKGLTSVSDTQSHPKPFSFEVGRFQDGLNSVPVLRSNMPPNPPSSEYPNVDMSPLDATSFKITPATVDEHARADTSNNIEVSLPFNPSLDSNKSSPPQPYLPSTFVSSEGPHLDRPIFGTPSAQQVVPVNSLKSVKLHSFDVGPSNLPLFDFERLLVGKGPLASVQSQLPPTINSIAATTSSSTPPMITITTPTPILKTTDHEPLFARLNQNKPFIAGFEHGPQHFLDSLASFVHNPTAILAPRTNMTEFLMNNLAPNLVRPLTDKIASQLNINQIQTSRTVPHSDIEHFLADNRALDTMIAQSNFAQDIHIDTPAVGNYSSNGKNAQPNNGNYTSQANNAQSMAGFSSSQYNDAQPLLENYALQGNNRQGIDNYAMLRNDTHILTDYSVQPDIIAQLPTETSYPAMQETIASSGNLHEHVHVAQAPVDNITKKADTGSVPQPGTNVQQLLIPGLNLGQGSSLNAPVETIAQALATMANQAGPQPRRAQEVKVLPLFEIGSVNTKGEPFNVAAKITEGPPSSEPLSHATNTATADLTGTMDIVAEQCRGQYINGVAYAMVEDSCTQFIQCFNDGGMVTSRTVSCPFETFFDEVHSVCRDSRTFSCWRDPCSNYKLSSYADPANCRAYWSCEGAVSVPRCCPKTTAYMSGMGCVRNTTCTDRCMDFGNLNKVVAAAQCPNTPMRENREFYFEQVAGMGWAVRRCPLGSRYDQAQCRCKAVDETINNNCKPEVYLDFTDSVQDKSGNNLYMGNVNVGLYGDTGAFSGRSVLQLWRFSGMSLGQHVTISFRFRLSVTAQKGRLMHIVSNCCFRCESEPQPSLDLAIIPGERGGIGVFSIRTHEAGEVFMFVPYQDTFTGWNTLEFSYDGMDMRGAINGQSGQKQVIGDIIGRPETLLIGACGIKGAFDGFLDEFKFYMCNP